MSSREAAAWTTLAFSGVFQAILADTTLGNVIVALPCIAAGGFWLHRDARGKA